MVFPPSPPSLRNGLTPIREEGLALDLAVDDVLGFAILAAINESISLNYKQI